MEDITASFWTWRHAGHDTAAAFYHYLQQHPRFTPEKVGSFEPLHLPFGKAGEEGIVRLLVDEHMLLTVRSSAPHQHLTQINLVEPKKPNGLNHSIAAEDLGKSLSITDYIAFLKDLFLLFDFDYGCARHKEDWYRKNMEVTPRVKRSIGVNLKQYLPGVYWANFFGLTYVRKFGSDTIRSAPAYSVEEVAESRFLLLSTATPFEYDRPDIQQRERKIVEHLGRGAFFDRSAA